MMSASLPCKKNLLWPAAILVAGAALLLFLWRYGTLHPYVSVFLAGFIPPVLAALFLWSRNRGYFSHCAFLEAENDRYNRALKAAKLGFWEWDIEKKTLLWDGYSADIFGFDANEKLGRDEQPVINIIAEDDPGITREQVLQRLKDGLEIDGDYRIPFPGGKDIWVHVQGKADRWKDGKPLAMSGIVTDATSRKKNEIELLRSNEELERFAYVASHDLKAPLRAINNLVQWVIEDTADIMPKASRDNLDLLTERASRMGALLEDILTYSRAGRMVDSTAEVETAALVRTIAETTLPQSFQFIISGDMPILSSPRTQLEQVFSNLISNAAKHHDSPSGTITVSARDAGAFYEFVVSDDGPGIDPAYHTRVFEMFQTLQSKDKVDGSGLGLAIVKKLVDWKGGKVWIESEKGQRGTAVHFLWPKK